MALTFKENEESYIINGKPCIKDHRLRNIGKVI